MVRSSLLKRIEKLKKIATPKTLLNQIEQERLRELDALGAKIGVEDSRFPAAEYIELLLKSVKKPAELWVQTLLEVEDNRSWVNAVDEGSNL